MKKISTLAAVALILAGCSLAEKKIDVSVNEPSVELFVGESHQIIPSGGQKGDYVFWSLDSLIAGASPRGVVTARKVGEVRVNVISVGSSAPVYVTVKPRHTAYEEPFIGWNTKQAKLIDTLGREPDYEDPNTGTLYYYGGSAEKPYQTLYFIENDQLVASAVLISKQQQAEVLGFLDERYFIADLQDENYDLIFLNTPVISKLKYVIGVRSVTSDILGIYYMPVGTTQTAAGKSIDAFGVPTLNALPI